MSFIVEFSFNPSLEHGTKALFVKISWICCCAFFKIFFHLFYPHFLELCVSWMVEVMEICNRLDFFFFIYIGGIFKGDPVARPRFSCRESKRQLTDKIFYILLIYYYFFQIFKYYLKKNYEFENTLTFSKKEFFKTFWGKLIY